MDEGHCEETANSPSEGSAESGTRRNTKINKTIKHGYILLENTDCELKKCHEYCLQPPKTKKLPQKINARKIGIFKALQVSLYDILDSHCFATPRDLENKKVNKLESVLELKATNTYPDVEKSERKASFPNCSMLCDNIFEKFSLKWNLENSIADLCHVEEKEKGADSVLIPEVQNAESEKCVEHGKMLIKQTERKEASPGTDTLVSKYSRETSTDNTSQPSRINMIDRSGEILQTPEANSVGSSVILCNETRFSKICHRNKGTSPLCELKTYLSLLPGNALKLDLKDEFPRKRRKEGSMNEHFVLSTAEVVTQEQETVGELDALNQTMTMTSRENNDSCLFKLEMDKATYIGGPADAMYEEKMSKKMLSGDHNCDVPPSGCQSFLSDVTTIKHSEDHKETTLKSREVSNAEECGDSQPAKENSSAGEMSGSTVKLLGTPRENSEMLCLDRLIELDESSDSDEQSSSHLKRLLVRRRSRLPQKGLADAGPEMLPGDQLRNMPLPPVGCSNDSRAKERRTWRPNKRLALICSSKLSLEASRIKVVESLTEVLQKRLDDSPNLAVQEDTVRRIAKKVEKALFNLSCCVDQHYRNKYRSLLFNLKSTKNQHLFYKVILGLISPERLVQMNALELAPEELAEWRAREQKHALQVIEKEEREAPRRCLTKFTHKGIVEIDRETYEDLTFQEVFGSQLLEDENSPLDVPAPSMRYSKDNHRSRTRNSDCFSDTGQMAADSKGGYKPPTHECILKQKANVSKCLQSNAMYSIRGERWLQEDSIPKKHLQVEKKSRASVIWKGLIQMFSLKQFVAEAYPVSGSGCHLFQALPDLLQSRGCILPEDVWAYLDSIWPANTKEMALIRFHPSLTKGHNPYNMLYSYLNKKQRYGIVGSNEMEMFMVPLAAYQPVPSKLHPLGGPGLDLCHPSLLLGLILPKRPPTGPDPCQTKGRRKTVTFKNNLETRYFPPPLQADNCQMQPPQHLSLSEPLCCHDNPTVALPRHDPVIGEELGREMLPKECSSSHYKTAGGGASHSLLDLTLHSQCDSPWLMGQLGSLTPETLGAQSQQAGDEVWVCTDREPLQIWSPLLSSETVCPNHCRVDGDQGVNISNPSLLLDMLCPETVLPAKAFEALLAPQIPSTTPIAGDINSLVEETLSLIQHLTQSQLHMTSNQETQPFPELSFPIMSQETTSVLSPAIAGLEFPAVHQSEDGMCSQLQLLLSTLGGQTQPPSTC